MATRASYPNRQPGQPATLVSTVHNYRAPVKFDHAFIERRFAQHREWQAQQIAEGSAEIVSEVLSCYQQAAKVKAARDAAKRLK